MGEDENDRIKAKSEEDEDRNNLIAHHELLKSRMAIQNNVITKRKEQLKAWEKSEMNKLPAIRKPPSTAHVKFQDSDIFFSACVSGDEDELEDLLDKGANVNTSTIDGVTALHQAVIDNKFEMVRFLVNRGADINAQDNEGWTPLHAAVCCGNILIVKFLCEKGADITVANSDKELAVDLAEDDEIKAYLEQRLSLKGVTAEECRAYEERQITQDCMNWIRSGNYLDKPHSKTGGSALHVAASKGYNKLISLLVQAGADINSTDFEGWTPLHAAAHWGEKDACRILMSRGADLNKRTLMGQDVLQVADSSLVEYLEQVTPSSNTSSSISSIQTRSRSITPEEEESSSSLYSSDQSVALTFKIPTNTSTTTPQQQNNSNSSSGSSGSSSGGSSSEKQTTSTLNNSLANNRNLAPTVTKTEPTIPKEAPPPVPPKTTTIPLTRLASPSSETSISASTVSESSSSTMSSRRPNQSKVETPKQQNGTSTPTFNPQITIQRINSHLTTPTIASATRQKATMVRSASTQNPPLSATTTTAPAVATTPTNPNFVPRDTPTSNPPWVNHWKSAQGTIQIRGAQQRAPSAASSTSSTANESLPSASSTPATSPAPGYFKPSISQAIQPTPAYKKSWQTPPQQPTPQKESEAERKAKSRLQRASRRSTQGVTLDQLNEARSAASSPTVNSSSNNATAATDKTDDIGKWKSSALQQQSKIVSSRDASTSSESNPSNSTSAQSTTATSISSNNSLKPTVTSSLSTMSKQTNVPTLPTETPSAARLPRRRSELRSNRYGTNSTDSEMLSSVSSSSVTTGRDLKQTSSSQQLDDGTKSPTAIVQPMQTSSPTPIPTIITSGPKPYVVGQRLTSQLLQDRVNSVDDEKSGKESASDDNYKPPVIPRTLPPATLPKSTDQFQNGSMTNLKEATFGSTADSHYKALYEKSLEENDRLRKQIDDLKYGKPKEPVDPQLSNGSNIYVTVRKNYNGTNHSSSGGSHSPSPTATQSTGNSTHLDDLDRRGYERKISELEYELQKARQLQSDHKRLKDENNALIRVISKLSKDTGAQTKTATSNGSK